jgi:flagellum-specific ATP synthase
VNIGAYQTGSNPTIDRAIEFIGPIRAFLRQKAECFSTAEETLGALAQICADARGSGA